jgi:hypothetical protein
MGYVSSLCMDSLPLSLTSTFKVKVIATKKGWISIGITRPCHNLKESIGHEDEDWAFGL